MTNILTFIVIIFVVMLVCDWVTLPYKVNDTNKLLKEIIELLKEKKL